MRTALLLLFSCSIVSAADFSIDGVYFELSPDANAQPIFTGMSIELNRGRFTMRNISKEAPKATLGGKYEYVAGRHLVFTGDSPDFKDLRVSVVYGGVALLMDVFSHQEFLKSGKLGSTLRVRMRPEEANKDGWRRFLGSHPKFKRAVVK